jgi:hypothetical protein
MSRATLRNSTVVYKKLTKAFGKLEKDHKPVLGMIEKCTKLALLFYDEIDLEKEINNDRDSNDDDFQESGHNDSSVTNFEDIPVNQVSL